MDSSKILFKEESYQIIGCCMKIHKVLGTGFLEAVYEEVLEKEFIKQNISYQRQVSLDLYYEGIKLNKKYRVDFICYDKIVVEIKAVNLVPIAFYKQLHNYLKATNLELVMLINFGAPSLTYKRILNRTNTD